MLIRCSKLSEIMSDSGAITATELGKLKKYAARDSGKKKPLTKKQKEELARLIKKRDNPELPESVKSSLIEIYTEQFENRNDIFLSPEIEKGNARENAGLVLAGIYLKRKLVKNTERKFNDWITGEIDTSFSENNKLVTLDIKNSYTRISFNKQRYLKKINPVYEWQGRGYMMLWGASKHIVCHVLTNGLASHIQSEIRRLGYSMEIGSDAFVKAARQIEINHIFDLRLFQNENPDYEFYNDLSEWKYDIPAIDRVTTYEFERSEVLENKIIDRVDACNKWINETIKIQ